MRRSSSQNCANFAQTRVGTDRAEGLRDCQRELASREPERTTMRHSLRIATLFVITSLAALTSLGGCADIGEAIDCDQMCEELETCIDSDLNVHRCSDRCEDEADNSRFRDKLDECTDCLDRDYACGEIEDRCPICADVADELL